MISVQPKPNTSTCPRCGAGLRCAMVAGDAECWCAQLPQVMPVPVSLPLPERAGVAAGTDSDLSTRPHPNPPPAGEGTSQATVATCFCPACLKQITDEQHAALFPPCD